MLEESERKEKLGLKGEKAVGWFVAGFVVGVTLAVAVDSMEFSLVTA